MTTGIEKCAALKAFTVPSKLTSQVFFMCVFCLLFLSLDFFCFPLKIEDGFILHGFGLVEFGNII